MVDFARALGQKPIQKIILVQSYIDNRYQQISTFPVEDEGGRAHPVSQMPLEQEKNKQPTVLMEMKVGKFHNWLCR